MSEPKSASMFITAPGNKAARAVTGRFMAEQAVWAEDAIAYVPPGPAERAQFERMLARGVIKQAGQGRYWLDTAAYTADRGNRNVLAGTIAGALAAIAAIVLMLSYRG